MQWPCCQSPNCSPQVEKTRPFGCGTSPRDSFQLKVAGSNHEGAQLNVLSIMHRIGPLEGGNVKNSPSSRRLCSLEGKEDNSRSARGPALSAAQKRASQPPGSAHLARHPGRRCQEKLLKHGLDLFDQRHRIYIDPGACSIWNFAKQARQKLGMRPNSGSSLAQLGNPDHLFVLESMHQRA